MKKIKIWLVENIHPAAKAQLEKDGFQVDLVSHAPSESELIEKLSNYQAIGIRSKTEITEKVLEKNPHLLAIGCFCIGTNQVKLKKANRMGIPVFNAPHSNTRSVAEMVLAEMIFLARRLGDKSMRAHHGEWDKMALGSYEVRGKTLGIVGYGHIGSQLSILAEGLGLKVLFYDIVKKLPLGNAQSVPTLTELLSQSDFVSLHVPKTPQTENMITQKQISKMKKGSYLINASRGDVVQIDDLAIALKEKHLAGAAIDVFPVEPSSNTEKFKTPLQGIENVILTPHVGGSTEEAQYSIGLEVAESFRKFIRIGSTAGAVNFPNVELSQRSGTSRLLNVHRNEPGVLGEINSIISEAKANIEAQYLSTDQSIGYLVADIEGTQGEEISKQIEQLSRNIRVRLI